MWDLNRLPHPESLYGCQVKLAVVKLALEKLAVVKVALVAGTD